MICMKKLYIPDNKSTRILSQRYAPEKSGKPLPFQPAAASLPSNAFQRFK
ncbi:hypothetical protein HMPREF9141_1971 [Prevotella multiformis DSM 16608]|uniref:Uncharacterized protein n=1 Tax=Prevotella multiformis DSM 16608 TaxID=888743 RepID=F0F8Q4_9BACT|nr:hypothetical protein HMPREF9141_1971 [Prevotella multiformis DSM 16608]